MSSAVPEGWKQKVVGDVVTLQYGKSPKDVFDDDGEYPVIGTGGITGYANTYLHEGETTVIGRKGTINKPSYISGKFWAIDTTYYAERYRGADPRWFFYTLQDTDLTRYNEASGVPSLSRDTLYSISIKFPPLPEQKKIASILTAVDEVIEKTESQIAKLQDLKTGMMQELLTKGIGHTEFKDSPVGRIPVGWEVKALKDTLHRLIDCEHKTAPYVDESDYLVIRTGNVRNGEIVYDDMKFTTPEGFEEWTKRSVPGEGDILFTREAPAGESCLVPKGKKMCLGQRMVLLKPDNSKMLSGFLSWYLVSQFARLEIYRLSIGTTVTRINIEDIYKIPCVLPSTEEQHSICTAIDSISNRISKAELQLNKIKSTKRGLMQDLLTGKVRVRGAIS
jgi:type I restriction enzyme S subunit